MLSQASYSGTSVSTIRPSKSNTTALNLRDISVIKLRAPRRHCTICHVRIRTSSEVATET